MSRAHLLQNIIAKKTYLAWYIKDKANISDLSALEHILAYGDWDDYKQAEEILGLPAVKKYFQKMSAARRINLRPATINLFTHYLNKYA